MRRASAYAIINNELYKRSTSGVFIRCVKPEEGRRILHEIHSGDCGHHVGARNLVAKAFRHGFFWLSAHQDAVDIVRRCIGCQKYARQDHLPAAALKTIPLTWPFAVWGIDMVGKFKTARGGMTHLLVAVDKFTKWVEVEPIKKLDGKTATKFLQKLIFRFGYPHSIITDNATNFAEGEMKAFCKQKGIRLDLASVAHPQSNGQAERMNQTVLAGIKPRLQVPLERTPGCWLDELPAVLWGIRTTPNRSTGYTPFFMVYGAEAVMPTDLEHDSPRVALYNEEENEEARLVGVDLLEEARELALSRTAIYQQSLRRYHSRRVRSRSFQEGDLVLRLIQKSKGMHKLSAPWEGPFVVSKAMGNGSYHLVDLREPNKSSKSEEETKRPWNISLLRPYYT